MISRSACLARAPGDLSGVTSMPASLWASLFLSPLVPTGTVPGKLSPVLFAFVLVFVPILAFLAFSFLLAFLFAFAFKLSAFGRAS